MSSQQLDEEAIFHVARDIPVAESRRKYLDQVCAGDQALRDRVEALLEVHENEQAFLKSDPDAAPTVDHAPLTEHPGTTIGRYKLMEQIGEGGMGTVFVAEQQRPLQRKVALKVIKPGMDTKEVIARFEAERQALAMMDHTNIARVFDAGTTESGRPYFVMELVRGVPITEYCDQNRLTIHERLQLFVQVCRAIQHAHQKGIIHRDIKPTNVLVTLHDGKPIPKVIDFGVAKALHQRLTERTIYTSFAQVVGTPMYMSPEQAELSGLDIDTRTDVYSLGVLLYELLTGTTPFDKQQFERAAYDEIRRIIREEEPPKASTRISSLGATATTVAEHRKTDLHSLQKAVRGDLDWILMTTLEKDRTRRYGTANDLAQDIERYLKQEPVSARSPSSAYRLQKFVRRNKGPVVAVIVVLVALVAGTLLASIGFIRAKLVAVELENKVSELQSAKERLASVYFEQALAAAMSGNDSKASKVIEEAKELDVLQQAQIEMLEGQRLLFAGQTQAAYSHLKEAANLAPDSILPPAMLVTAYALGGNEDPMLPHLTAANRLAETKKLTPLEILFLGQARLYENTDAGWNLLKSLPLDYRSPLGDAIMADAHTHRANERNSVSDIRKAITRLDNASAYMPDNAYVIMVDLWAHIAALRIIDPTTEEYVQLRQEGRELADRMKQHLHFSVATWCRMMFWYEIGEFDTAMRHEEDSLRIGDAFMVAVLRYRMGDLSIADELRGRPDHYSSSWNRAALAYTVGFEPQCQEEIKTIYHRLCKVRQEYAKWFLPEMFLLFQDDHEFRRQVCSDRLGDGELSRWEAAAIQFVGESMPSDQLLEISESRRELSRAHLMIGIRHLLLRNRVDAKTHLNQCVQMKMGNEWYWADAMLTRMELQPEWRSAEAATHKNPPQPLD